MGCCKIKMLFHPQDIRGQIRCVRGNGFNGKITEGKNILVLPKKNGIVLIHELTS